MFSSDSRYRRSRIVPASNRAGQTINTVELRLPPPTAGTFQHAVEEGERIDRLAHKFYRNPRKWWRIADANPAFLSPDALLGQSALVTERLSLQPPVAPVPWAPALAAGLALSGVVRLERAQNYRLDVEEHLVLGEQIEVVRERVDEAVIATYNRFDLDPAALLAVFTSRGFTVVGREPQSQVGQPIIIPPDGGP